MDPAAKLGAHHALTGSRPQDDPDRLLDIMGPLGERYPTLLVDLQWKGQALAYKFSISQVIIHASPVRPEQKVTCQKKTAWHHAINTVGQPGGPTTVLTGMPVIGLAPATLLVSRAAGRPMISTVGEPITIDPTHTVPDTRSPITDAGIPPIKTVGAPGPVIASPVTVISPTRAAGNGISHRS
jgi:hypothetical protein